MDHTPCERACEKHISARSIEKAQELLRRMAPRPPRAHTYEESIAYRGGRFVTTLRIAKRKVDPETRTCRSIVREAGQFSARA